MRVAVVGAGPSGLVTLKYLTTAHEFFPGLKPIDARLFETEANIGGTFRYRSYEDGELVSSKFLTSYSDFRASFKDPQFMSVPRYLEYLEDYCTRFALWSHIHLSTTVVSIRRRGEGHLIRYRPKDSEEQQWECDAVAVCSGLHVTPEIPKIPGLEHVPTVLHSSEFKGRKQFGEDKTIAILGVGETSMDISYMAITSPTKRVVVCHRSGWVNAPKLLAEYDFIPSLSTKPALRDPYKHSPGIPIDCAHNGLFDTAYVHPIIRDSFMLWNFHHYIITGFLPWLLTGTYLVWDQWVGKPRDPNHHLSNLVFNKSNLAMPYINAPFQRVGQGSFREWIRAKLFRTPHPDLGGRVIDLASWPTHVDDAGRLHFSDNGTPEYERMKNEDVRPDVVILATGYKQEFPFFAEQDAAAVSHVREGGNEAAPEEKPYARPKTAKVRHIWAKGDPTVAFIGFLRPQIGAIPPIAEMQAMLWTIAMVRRFQPSVGIPGLAGNDLPKLRATEQWHYQLLRGPDNRIQYGVDHDSYVYQLACDMDCAPTFSEMLAISVQRGWKKGWNLIPTWAMVSQVNTKFRLRGPWRWDGAADVLHGELWTLVERNGGFVGAGFQAALPFLIFGTLNLACWVYATVLGVFHIETKGPFTPVNTDEDD